MNKRQANTDCNFPFYVNRTKEWKDFITFFKNLPKIGKLSTFPVCFLSLLFGMGVEEM